MAYLETLTAQITGILNDAGIEAYAEFAQGLEAPPNGAVFATVSIAAMHCGTPITLPDGSLTPAAVTVRVRLHCAVQENTDRLAICLQNVLLPALLDRGYAVSSLTLGEIAYSKTLDRMLREVHIEIPAAVLRRETG